MHTEMERLYEAAKSLKGIVGQSALAKFLGESPQTIKNWETRGISKQGLLKAHELIGCTIKWLKYGEGDIALSPLVGGVKAHPVRALSPEDPLPPDVVQIKEYRLAFSAGFRELEFVEETETEPSNYQLSWFRTNRISPKKCKRFSVIGDSMEPLLFEGDKILVNLAETEIVSGKIYALRYRSIFAVKRVIATLDGSIVLRSENKLYSDEVVDGETAAEHITIIGRVRDRSGSSGL